MQLTFMGAVGTVTGSKFLLSAKGKNILIDCGLFQGYKELRLRNWSKLPIDPRSVDAVVLTHAHIDHSGYLPLLVKNGFKGKIYCTPGTFDLCRILLPNSGYLQEEEARLSNKYHSSTHHPALPLYTSDDAKHALKYFEIIDFNKAFDLLHTFEIRFYHAGHILGAAMVSVKQGETSLLFSGDLGRPNDTVMRAPDIITQTDYLILESTYGDRLHDVYDPEEKLGEIIRDTAKKGGTVLIPSFAVGRTQAILYHLYKLKQANKIPPLPIFLDSPMATGATAVMCQYQDEYRPSHAECELFCRIATPIETLEESHAIDHPNVPSIIISASGMATGGRVLHHLKELAPNFRNTIVFAGYQAAGTRGDQLVKGEPFVKIFGEMVPVKARVELLHNLSAHADYQEILYWLANFTRAPKKVFITHGEPNATISLKTKIEEKFAWPCIIPHYLQKENV